MFTEQGVCRCHELENPGMLPPTKPGSVPDAVAGPNENTGVPPRDICMMTPLPANGA